jgi:hypothetical protein
MPEMSAEMMPVDKPGNGFAGMPLRKASKWAKNKKRT